MGVVYKAEDTRLKRMVALKFLPANLSAGGSERERFILEAQAASALNHPNVATVYAIDEENGESYIAMEYVDGETLKSRIARAGFQVREALQELEAARRGLVLARAERAARHHQVDALAVPGRRARRHDAQALADEEGLVVGARIHRARQDTTRVDGLVGPSADRLGSMRGAART